MFNFLSKKFSNLFSGLSGKHINAKKVDEVLVSVREALLESDVPYSIVEQFIKELRTDCEKVNLTGSLKPKEQLMKLVYDKLVFFLGGDPSTEKTDAQKLQEYAQRKERTGKVLEQDEMIFPIVTPMRIAVVGLQGSGKTTTLAKLGAFIHKQAQKESKKIKILAASTDFARPAAIDQLEVVARQAHVDFYRTQAQNPVKAAVEVMDYVREHDYNVLLLDTAGRLHVDDALLQELSQVIECVRPTHTLLVIDAMTGQESLRIAESFAKVIPITGAILTKMDSDARAGSALAFRLVLGKSILFAGTGERIEDLELFRPGRIASRMLDAGDLLTLVEQAEEKIAQDEQKKMERAFESGDFTLDDFADQLRIANRFGSLSSLMKYIPGAGSMSISPDMLEKAEKEMKSFRAIMSSMTRKERRSPKILDQSRKLRIARGAGLGIKNIDQLLTKFEQSKQFVKLFKQMGSQGPRRKS